jgi:ABC-type dipeptide/oligopeptide/nickel transport system permease subunit
MIASILRTPRALRPAALIVGTVIVAGFAILALLAPWISPADPDKQDLLTALAGPSGAHWLGTDALGRDITARILHGARLEIGIVVPSVLAALIVALPFGLLSGYHGRWIDRVISTVSDSVLTFPSLVIAIVLVAVLGTGRWPMVITLIVTQAPQMVRYIRGFTRQIASRPYILASRASGSRAGSILVRHVLRNILGSILVILSLFASEALLVIAALGFLGIGVQPPTPEWGTMLSEGRADFAGHPHVMIFPGLAIAVLILGFNLLGDGLRDRLDQRL